MGDRNQVGIGLSYRPASLCSLATQCQTRWLKFSTLMYIYTDRRVWGGARADGWPRRGPPAPAAPAAQGTGSGRRRDPPRPAGTAQTSTGSSECQPFITLPEAKFLDVIGTKVLRVFLLAIHSHLYTANEGPLRIQYKCLVPIYVFPEMKLLFPKQNYNVLSPIVPTLIHLWEIYIYICGNWDSGRAIPRKGIHKWDFPSSVLNNY